ncbi:MAG: S8 family serine peptidase [Candidatus Stygibacter australis]|nr:S8 family serine peptidase [Candidatus Stygibacter australis]
MRRKIILTVFIILLINCILGVDLPFSLKNISSRSMTENLPDNEYLSPLIQTSDGYAVDVVLRGEFPLNDLPESSSRVVRYGNLTTMRLPVSELTALENIAGIEEIYPSIKSEELLDISTSDHMSGASYAGCDADYIQEQLGRGDGVIVGLIDPYPLNWQHEDFSDESGTRIAAIWNQSGTGNAPILFGYGSEYSAADLNSGTGPAINSGQHHGTQCTGIAAGDGSASGGSRAGMLPGAQIIYVQQSSGSANIINAIVYIAQKAAEIDSSKPVVISMSIGSMFSEPDGSDPVAEALTSFGGAGRCSAVAAGNWYNYDCFVTGNAQYGDPVTDLNFTLSGSNTGGNDFVISRLYYQVGDDFSITLSDQDGNSYGAVSPGADEIFDTPGGRLYISHEVTSLGNPYLELVVSDEYGTMTAGDNWTIELDIPNESLDDAGGFWWGWIAGVGYNADFENYYQGAYSLNVYACGSETICVGAHDKTNGNIYSACSKGAPDIVIKPELTAPTNAYTTNAASSTGYSSLCCTSGAAPHAAGAMGLILERFSDLQPAELIGRLTATAFVDAQTGAVPNDRWGYGKLNAKGGFLLVPCLGDVDNSYEVDAFDSSIVLMIVAGINYFAEEDPLPWEEWRFNWADVDGNGVIESYDASLILQFVVELIDEFPNQ